jgi:hypothetical protein
MSFENLVDLLVSQSLGEKDKPKCNSPVVFT